MDELNKEQDLRAQLELEQKKLEEVLRREESDMEAQLHTPPVYEQPEPIVPQAAIPPQEQPVWQQPYQQGYNVAPFQNQPMYPPYGYTQAPTAPTKKKKTGLIVFLVIFSAVLVIALSGLAVTFVRAMRNEIGSATTTTRPGNQLGENPGASTDDGNNSGALVLTPVTDDRKELPAEDVVAQNKDKVIAIVSYDSNGTIKSEASGVFMGTNQEGTKTYVVTCAHVISENLAYRIQMEDGTEYDAAVVGYDTKTDLGILSISQTGFPVAEFGDSSQLRQGQTVLAIGNPGGTAYYGSVTRGMVSAVDRPIQTASGYTFKSIQHDAAVNPGNSGGALFNLYGQVVGINSAKLNAAEGMGFAVPSTVMREVINELIQNGKVTSRARLGIQYQGMSSYVTQADGVRVPAGAVYITEIDAESDLASKDVKVGDVIIGMNGQMLASADVLVDLIEKSKIGDTITLSVIRYDTDGKTVLKEFDVDCKLIAG